MIISVTNNVKTSDNDSNMMITPLTKSLSPLLAEEKEEEEKVVYPEISTKKVYTGGVGKLPLVLEMPQKIEFDEEENTTFVTPKNANQEQIDKEMESFNKNQEIQMEVAYAQRGDLNANNELIKNYEKNHNEKYSEQIADGREMTFGDKVDMTLSVGGLAPVWGIFSDAANLVQNLGQAAAAGITGDFDEMKHDLENAGWATAGIIPFGIGQFFTGIKHAKNSKNIVNTVKNTSGTKNINSESLLDFIRTADDAAIQNSKLLTNEQKVSILNTRVDARIAKAANAGDVVNGVDYYKGATHYGEVNNIEKYNTVKNQVVAGQTSYGRTVDANMSNINFTAATDLKPDMVNKIGTQSGRNIYEVTFPDGSTQRFWRSSGKGGKTIKMPDGTNVSSEGFFGTLPGHMDIKLPYDQAVQMAINSGAKMGTKQFDDYVRHFQGTNGWFVKSGDWQGYGSTTFQQTGAVLKNWFDSGLLK